MNRRLLKIMLGSLMAMVLCFNVEAQQVSGSFTDWEDCLPNGKNVVGEQPVGWNASNVYQFGFMRKLVFKDEDRAGVVSTSFSAKLTNDFVGLGKLGANVPGFISLGKMWVYASLTDIAGGDGGVLGGMDFTSRPDSVVVYIKRQLGTENPNEAAKVITYLWKGEFKSKIKTGKGETADAIDRDKYILGMEEPLEGSTGVLIAKSEYAIEGTFDNWTRLSIPIEYLTNDTPEKMNIIISTGNYWVREDIGKGNTLWVDDLELIYNPTNQNIVIDNNNVKVYSEDGRLYVSGNNNNEPIEVYNLQGVLLSKSYQEEIVVENLSRQ
ncbi:hypothetical protein M2138_002135, partial [Dysgonomonadaceae bacterium PH5-43]|nr:hypothetical protein [Dysgonomonadaceae bacterium PH5-43]